MLSGPVDGIIYAGSKYKPYLAVRAGGSGDITTTHRAWQIENGPDVPTQGAGVAPALFNDDDLLIFSVTADKVDLSDGLSGYSSRAGVYLPLGELTRLLAERQALLRHVTVGFAHRAALTCRRDRRS